MVDSKKNLVLYANQYVHCIYGPKLETSPTISLRNEMIVWLVVLGFIFYLFIFFFTNAYTNLRCDINSFICWVFRVIVVQNWQAARKLSVGTFLGWYQRWRFSTCSFLPCRCSSLHSKILTHTCKHCCRVHRRTTHPCSTRLSHSTADHCKRTVRSCSTCMLFQAWWIQLRLVKAREKRLSINGDSSIWST